MAKAISKRGGNGGSSIINRAHRVAMWHRGGEWQRKMASENNESEWSSMKCDQRPPHTASFYCTGLSCTSLPALHIYTPRIKHL
jgi:hypothetical protein